MIKHIKIINFALIENIDIDFENGMNILLGETGAGKSIIIEAISLLQGNRAEYEKIRFGETRALIEGEFLIENNVINDYLKNLNIDINNSLIKITRVLEKNKSICKINEINISQTQLKQLMDIIIDIHSQHKDNSFFDEQLQIRYFDQYILKNNTYNSDFKDLIKFYKDGFVEYQKQKSELNQLMNKKSSSENIDYLIYQIQEIEKYNLKENELEEIDEELNKLNNFSKIYDNFKNFQENYKIASNYLYAAKRDLASINGDSFEDVSSRFNDAYYELEDVYETLEKEFNNYESSLERYEYLNQRKMELNPLKRKYGRSSEDIINAYRQFQDELNILENIDYLIESLNNKLKLNYDHLIDVANQIHDIRLIAKSNLELDMNENFQDLALTNALFKVELTTNELNENGIDNVKFLLRANLGQNFLGLKDSASLGETSRINLAYKLVFNKLKPVSTIIFDEIDTGISSNVALLVSKKIKLLSKSCQTIVITHLPQMVAAGENVILVNKIVENGNTKTRVQTLNNEQKIKEISKMISGNSINEVTIKAAENLIDTFKIS